MAYFNTKHELVEPDVIVSTVEEPIVEVSKGVFEVDADESVSDVFERLEYEDPEENEELINTLMGEWAYEQFTAIPQPGDHFSYHRVHVTVIGMEHNRILKLRVTLLPEEEGGESA
jgi:CBS domain containing-hemolysin-like protein